MMTYDDFFGEYIYIYFDYSFVFNIMMIADLLALNTTKQTLSGR